MKSSLGFLIGAVIVALIYVLWVQPKWIQERTLLEQQKNSAETSLKAAEAKTERFRRASDETRSFLRTVLEKSIKGRVRNVGLPLVLEIRRFDRIGEDKENDVDWIVNGFAIPLFRDEELVGIFSLPFDPREKPSGRGVFGPMEADLKKSILNEIKKGVKKFLMEKVETGDQRIEIHWQLVGKGGRFHTHGVVGKNGSLKFESLLYFSQAEQDIDEKLSEAGGSTNLVWTGDVKNGLGLKAISWRGNVFYSWKEGRIIEKPVGKFTKLISHLPLWRMDHQNTGVKIGEPSAIVRKKNIIHITRAALTVGWSTGFKDQLKITLEKFGIEMHGLNTGRSSLTRVYELAGNGTVRRLIN